QLRRVATWVYFFIFAAISFLVIATAGGAFGGDTGSAVVIVNSPVRIATLLALLSVLGVPVTAALAGNSVYRDFQTGAYPLFFTTPIRPAGYLAGRWLGAVLANLVCVAGGVLGILVACAWPTVQGERVGPFHPLAYLVPLAILVLPNLLSTAAIFVTLTALTRRMLPAYVGGVTLLLGWAVSQAFVSLVGDDTIERLADPFALTTLQKATRYWTVVEQNLSPIPIDSLLLANRALWLGAGALIFGLGVMAFRFRQSGGEGRARAWQPGFDDAPPRPLHVPAAARSFTFGARLHQLAAETRRSVREVVLNVWFPVLLGVCLTFVAIGGTQVGTIYGTRTFPVTYKVVELVQGTFLLFTIVIIAFYAGELVWNERERRAAGIHDALPVPTWVPFTARLFALVGVVVGLLAAAMACGIAIQAAHGYFRFEPGLYLRSLFVHLLLGTLLPFVILALLVQTLVNHKYVGHLVVILVFVGQGLLYFLLGVKHNLLMYGSTPTLVYSDMNGFGHGERAWAWFALYWLLVGILLLVAASLFWVRGQETGIRWRLRLAKRRMTRGLLGVAAGVLALVAATGGFIFYNTNVLNHFETEKEGRRTQAEYERLYKRWEWAPHPRITAARLNVDVFPDTRDVWLRGSYTLTNRTGRALDTLHVDIPNSLSVRLLAPDVAARRVVSDSARGYYVYLLARPLAPGDSLRLRFDLRQVNRGFENEPSYQPAVNNGTFFNSQLLPHIGYNAQGELVDENERRKHHLPPRPRAASIHDPRARTRNFVSSDADWIAFDVTLGTAAGQTAVAPGYLRRTWTERGRRYFRYTMDAPILNFYAFLSARYAVRRDRWRNVAIEVYHDRAHPYNVGRMIRASKAALEYCTREFGPYQHRQVRILEFPRYAPFAQSFDNTIPYSEAIGFIADVRSGDIDYPYFVTAHEVAHQWWGHQGAPADVQGAAMLSETLAEYTALMVMEKEYGREKIGRFLRYELDQYLEGRGGERRAEEPLTLVENQQYIHYNKGALAMYALRDYIGEAAVNHALRAFLDEWRFRGPPYPVSYDLVRHLRAETPDSLQYVVTNLFEQVTLWENRAVTARSRTLPQGGGYEVTLTVEARKLLADSLGNEEPLPVNDWVDVGVYAGGRAAYLGKRRLTRARETFRITVADPPDSAGIDPEHKLIDRDLKDNVIPVGGVPRGRAAPPRVHVNARVRIDSGQSRRPSVDTTLRSRSLH
ncbi:MAG TPA: M1 family aminopeptidase, partial [Longimicrobium sp.]